ncbi:MAG: Abi family protein [Mycobacteriaceae bacterium]
MADWIDEWLGASRFAPYLTKASGDRQLGVELYEWNSALGVALMHDISHFEVAMRNAYDAAISAHWKKPVHWLLSPDSPVVLPIWRVREVDKTTGLRRGADVNYLNRKSVDSAINKSGKGNAQPGKVIAELSFGFWSHLTSNASEKVLWLPYIYHSYPAGTNRKAVDQAISRINTLRNRIAHHEPIFDRNN